MVSGKPPWRRLPLPHAREKAQSITIFRVRRRFSEQLWKEEAAELKIQLDKTIQKDDAPIDKLKTYILFRLHHVRTVENFYAALNEEYLSHMDFILEIRQQFDLEERQVVKEILEEGMQNGTFQVVSSEIGAIAIATMMKGLGTSTPAQ